MREIFKMFSKSQSYVQTNNLKNCKDSQLNIPNPKILKNT